MSGLEVFNANGTLRNSVGDNLTRYLGQTDGLAGQSGTIAWPFPDVPVARRFVTTVSNRPIYENEITTAWAYYDAAANVVRYSQGEDLQAISVLYFSF